MEGIHAVEACHTVGTDLLLIGEDTDGGVSGGPGLNFSHQRRIGIHTVIMAVRANHGTIQPHIPGFERGNNLNLRRGEIALGDAVALIQQTQNAQFDTVGGLGIADGQRPQKDVQVFAGNALLELFLVLLRAQMRQKIRDGKHRIIVLLADADLHTAAVLTNHNAMNGQRNGGPLVFAHAAIVMGAEISQAFLLIQGNRAQVQPGGIHMGNVQMKALRHGFGSNGGGQNALAAVDPVNLIAGVQLLSDHKRLIARFDKELFAVPGHFPLGLAAVQKDFISLAEAFRFRDGGGSLVRHRFVFVEHLFQFFGGFHNGCLPLSCKLAGFRTPAHIFHSTACRRR